MLENWGWNWKVPLGEVLRVALRDLKWLLLCWKAVTIGHCSKVPNEYIFISITIAADGDDVARMTPKTMNSTADLWKTHDAITSITLLKIMFWKQQVAFVALLLSSWEALRTSIPPLLVPCFSFAEPRCGSWRVGLYNYGVLCASRSIREGVRGVKV